MKRDDVDIFEKLQAQLESVHGEISLLSKKSPNDAVNKFKLKFVNSILSQCNVMLGEQHRPFDDFEVFSDDDLPSNSDVAFIAAQYLESCEKFRSDNIKVNSGYYYWVLEDPEERVRTTRPKKFSEK